MEVYRLPCKYKNYLAIYLHIMLFHICKPGNFSVIGGRTSEVDILQMFHKIQCTFFPAITELPLLKDGLNNLAYILVA